MNVLGSVLGVLVITVSVAACGSDSKGSGGAGSTSSCTVTVTGDVTYSGECRIFVCSPQGQSPSLDLIAEFGASNENVINFIGDSASVGTYDETSYPGGWRTIARQGSLDIRNDSASPLPAGVSLDAVISSVTPSTDSTDPCAGTAKGTVKGDIVVVGDAGTTNSAHFEFVMR